MENPIFIPKPSLLLRHLCLDIDDSTNSHSPCTPLIQSLTRKPQLNANDIPMTPIVLRNCTGPVLSIASELVVLRDAVCFEGNRIGFRCHCAFHCHIPLDAYRDIHSLSRCHFPLQVYIFLIHCTFRVYLSRHLLRPSLFDLSTCRTIDICFKVLLSILNFCILEAPYIYLFRVLAWGGVLYYYY